MSTMQGSTFKSLETFRSQFAVSPARQNRFAVSLGTYPILGTGGETNYGTFNDNEMYFIKGATMPARSFGEIILNWMGMGQKIAGDPVFEDCTIRVVNEYNEAPSVTPGAQLPQDYSVYRAFTLRNKFEMWMDAIAKGSDGSNQRNPQLIKYKSNDIKIFQLKSDAATDVPSSIIATVQLYGAFPKSIDSIDLNMDNNDTVSESAITLACDYWTITPGNTTTTSQGAYGT